MRPRTIVAVLDSPMPMKDPAVMWASSLARRYEATLHVAEIPGLLAGWPVRTIAAHTRRVGADLVVVADRAGRRQGYWQAGSFATALGKAVTAPTLVVPNQPPPADDGADPFRNIVSAIDFSDASFGALSAALTLVQQSGGRLRLLHVLDGFPYHGVYGGSGALRLGRVFRATAARIDSALQSLIPPDALNWSEIDAATVMGRVHDAILAHAADGRADLIVLGLPRRWRVTELLAGSTVHKVLRRATAPVLLVPGPSTSSHFRATAPAGPPVGLRPSAAAVDTFMNQVRAEYTAMPGLSVTLPQAQRLWAVDRRTCQEVFGLLVRTGVLRMTEKGRFVLT